MNELQKFIASKPMGFLAANELAELIRLDRLCPVLVRCGGGRFTCAAQDAAHFMDCVSAGGDYVRDVSFPVGSMERAARSVNVDLMEPNWDCQPEVVRDWRQDYKLVNLCPHQWELMAEFYVMEHPKPDGSTWRRYRCRRCGHEKTE
jgi:hypothetical protein